MFSSESGAAPCTRQLTDRFRLVFLILIIFSSGCAASKLRSASNRAPKTREVSIKVATDVESTSSRTAVVFESRPPGAAVFVDGSLIGTTPVTTRFVNKVDIYEKHRIVYRERTKVTITAGDAIISGALIVPVLVDVPVVLAHAKYAVSNNGIDTTYEFPEEVLSDTS